MNDDAKAMLDAKLYGMGVLKNGKHVPIDDVYLDPRDARIEALEAEIERLREALIGIRAEIDDMENPFNGDGNPEMRQGFEVAVDQAVNIVTAALEGGK